MFLCFWRLLFAVFEWGVWCLAFPTLLRWFRRGLEVGHEDPLLEARETLANDEMRSFAFFWGQISAILSFFGWPKGGEVFLENRFVCLSVIIFEVQVLFFRSSLHPALQSAGAAEDCAPTDDHVRKGQEGREDREGAGAKR